MAGKLVAALAKAKAGLDNAARAAAKQARRIQVTPPVGGIGHPSAKGVYKYVDGLSSPKISISDDGLVNLELPPSYRLDPEYAQTRGFRHIQELAWPYGDDEFIRVGGKNDASYLKSKTHKGSTNWHTGQSEGGLSVARDYETANDTAHLVRGKVIGQGSDSEPLLDLQSVEVLGGVPETFSADRVSALMRRYNISEDDAKSVLLTQFQRGADDAAQAASNQLDMSTAARMQRAAEEAYKMADAYINAPETRLSKKIRGEKAVPVYPDFYKSQSGKIYKESIVNGRFKYDEIQQEELRDHIVKLETDSIFKKEEKKYRHDQLIDSISDKAASHGLKTRVVRPSDSYSRYAYVTSPDGKEYKFRVADHDQPSYWDGDAKRYVTKGGIDSKTGIPHSPADFDFRPNDDFSGVDKILQDISAAHGGAANAAFDPANIGKNDLLGAATIGGMATAGAVGAGAMAAQQYDFGTPDYDAKVQAFNERQRSKKNFWKELKEAGAYLGNAIGAGVVSEAAGDIQWVSGMLPGGQAYREGYDQFDAKTNQTKEAFYNALMKAKLTGDNRFLQEFGQQIEQAGEDFRPAVDAIKASPLYPMWQSLPEPVRKGAAIVADWLP